MRVRQSKWQLQGCPLSAGCRCQLVESWLEDPGCGGGDAVVNYHTHPFPLSFAARRIAKFQDFVSVLLSLLALIDVLHLVAA